MNDPRELVRRILPYAITGRVSHIVGTTASIADFPAPLGASCSVDAGGGRVVDGEVVGFRDDETLVFPHGDLTGVRRGARVTLQESTPSVRVGDRMLGRVFDARGRCIDGGRPPILPHRTSLHRNPPSPLDRPRIDTPLTTSVRAIDGLLTCGRGQRLGIFAGSGVGKSTLLGQMARGTSADVNVVVLVGERGREVREFLDRDLGPEGLARSVVVVATGDEPALVRVRAAHYGTAVAEYFRDTGRDVLLVMDSVTRFVLAQREIGLAAGEPPATRGYPPSVFAALPRLLERSGRTESGSITGFYTVLVEADDANEPVSDAVRGILDGHVMLSRDLAARAHWPAIDVLHSVSRSMSDVVHADHATAANAARRLMATYESSRDLVEIGAYQRGTNADTDAAIDIKPEIDAFLRQTPDEASPFESTVAGLLDLNEQLQSRESAPQPVMPQDGEARVAQPA